MTIFACSDHHLGHARIIEMCKRPYTDVIEMNQDLILRHNAVVHREDIVYFIGDIIWNDNCMNLLSKMNGIHRFVLGGHDRKFFCEKHLAVNEIKKYDIWEIAIDGQNIVLCHFPLREWNGSYHGWWHIHGHCHGRAEEPKNCVDVSVDAWNFYPASFEQIKERIDKEKV